MKTVILRNRVRVAIRPQALQDSDGLWQLYSSLSAQTRMLSGIPSQEKMNWEEFRQRMVEVVEDKRRIRHVYVVSHPAEEEFIGYSEISTGGRDPQTGWIFFFVKDTYQHKGLGWMMLKHIIEEASSLGLKTLGAQVHRENKRAINLLKRFNFKIRKESVDPQTNMRSYTMCRAMVSYSFKTVDVQGVKYRTVRESEIRNYLLEVLRAEWEEEEFNKEWYPEMDRWDWSIEKLDISHIRLWKPLIEDPDFISDLERRAESHKEMFSRNEIIDPIVVRGRDMLIYDGYARFHALKQLGKSEILAYVGRESHRPQK